MKEKTFCYHFSFFLFTAFELNFIILIIKAMIKLETQMCIYLENV